MVVALIARIAGEEGRFDLGAVARGVGDKLVRRHPHVFGDVAVEGSEHVVANWEKIKQAEREAKDADQSALAGVPVALPALQRADRIVAKAMSAGFKWSDADGALAKLVEEVRELSAVCAEGRAGAPSEAAGADGDAEHRERLEHELGDVLIAAAFLGRYLDIDPERAARRAVRRFERRFRAMETSLGQRLREAPLDELVRAWEAAKAETR